MYYVGKRSNQIFYRLDYWPTFEDNESDPRGRRKEKGAPLRKAPSL
jgi:hypothetical protein